MVHLGPRGKTMPRTMTKKTEVDQVDSLRNSPIHGIKMVEDREVELNLIDDDPTNPGTDKFSRRYERRQPDIRDSFDIIGEAIYPLVISISSDRLGRFI